MKQIILSLTFLFLSAACVLAQDPDWHRVPAEDLLGNRGEIARILQSTFDETVPLEIWQRPETDEAVLYLKMLAAKRLGLYGTAAAVPILVPRLDNEKDGFYARYALETIPGDEVDAALCEALATIERPGALAGVLTTLGVRGNANSAAAIRPFLTHEDIDVRRAAGYAYALTAGNSGIEFFASGTIDPLFIDSGFLFAEQFEQRGDNAVAVRIYVTLSTANAKEYQRMAAIYRGILARGISGVVSLFQQLTPDLPRRQFEIGLKAGRQLPAGERAVVSRVLMTQYSVQTDPMRQSRVVRALGDRLDQESITIALPMMMTLARGEKFVPPSAPPLAEGADGSVPVPVRVAAIDALRNIGNASVVPILIEAAQSEEKTVADAAMRTLSNVPGADVDASIAALLTSETPAVQIIAIKLVAERRYFAAAPALLTLLQGSEGAVAEAAAPALGEISGIEDLPVLLKRLSQASSEAEIQKVLAVLKSACTRFAQNPAAEGVAGALEGASSALKAHLLDLLKEIAGAKALEIVESYAWGDDAEMRNVATRILGEWRSPADLDRLAAACLRLAKESEEYKIRGLRSYIRLARQFNMPDQRRLSMSQEVFDLADRDEERVLIFDVFSRVVSLDSLDKTVTFFDHETLKERAAETAVSIAERLQGRNARITAAMQRVLEVSGNNTVKERAQRVLDR